MRARLRACALALAACWLASGCVTPPPYDPWQVPKAGFHARVRTIGIARLVVPTDLADAEAVRQRLEPLIAAKLEQLGFRIVAAGDVDAVWQRMKEQLGGFYDPITGERDQEKFEAARRHALEELAARFQVDAVLHARIDVIDAPFEVGTARFCGASQPMASTGRQFLDAMVGLPSAGTIKASCLVVGIEDTSGVVLYVDAGGVEVLGKLVVGGFEPRPREELFADAARNRAAVDLALDSLATGALAARSR